MAQLFYTAQLGVQIYRSWTKSNDRTYLDVRHVDDVVHWNTEQMNGLSSHPRSATNPEHLIITSWWTFAVVWETTNICQVRETATQLATSFSSWQWRGSAMAVRCCDTKCWANGACLQPVGIRPQTESPVTFDTTVVIPPHYRLKALDAPADSRK